MHPGMLHQRFPNAGHLMLIGGCFSRMKFTSGSTDHFPSFLGNTAVDAGTGTCDSGQIH